MKKNREPKSENVNIVITVPEPVKKLVEKEAEKLGLGVSPYIRMLILKKIAENNQKKEVVIDSRST